MCDYSLHNVASRDAKVEDVLVTSGFLGSVTHGFASVGEENIACCVRPGTELAFAETIKTRGIWPTFGEGTNTGQKLARFRQVNVEIPHVHHDALELADGKIVLLHELAEGQKATVLQLPSVPQNAAQEGLEITARLVEHVLARS